jgi:transposase
VTDAGGLPLVVATGPANERDDRRAFALLDLFPRVPGRRGRPRTKPGAYQGDAGYGFADLIAEVARRGVRPEFRPRGKGRPHGSGLGRTRYVVERTLSWFGSHRRIKLCYERTAAHFQAFHELAACLILARRIPAALAVMK